MHTSFRRAGLLILLAAISASLVTAATASARDGKPKSEGKPEFRSLVNWWKTTSAFPSWSFTYTDPVDSNSYPMTMIGNDPKSGRPSLVKTVIIPLKMNFVAGGQDVSELLDQGYDGFQPVALNHTFDGNRRVRDVLRSPIFSPYRYPADMGGDLTQYGDAFMRAQFNQLKTNYHVLMVPTVLPTQTVDVPAADGLAYQRPVGAWRTAHGMPTDTLTGVADFGWFANYLIDTMTRLNLGPNVMPIFLTDNVMLYDGSYLNCCTIGFHGTPGAAAADAAHASLPAAQQTLMFAAWTTPGTYSRFMTDYSGTRTAPDPTRGMADIHALSHEVAEALDDPYVNNSVVPWLTPTAPQYGCTAQLETGDPVVGVWFPLDGNNSGNTDGYNYYGQYHPEENVFGQWYAHGGFEANGYRSWDGRLTFMGPRTTALGGPFADFGSYSHGC
jgi:hypothetical protein